MIVPVLIMFVLLTIALVVCIYLAVEETDIPWPYVCSSTLILVLFWLSALNDMLPLMLSASIN